MTAAFNDLFLDLGFCIWRAFGLGGLWRSWLGVVEDCSGCQFVDLKFEFESAAPTVPRQIILALT